MFIYRTVYRTSLISRVLYINSLATQSLSVKLHSSTHYAISLKPQPTARYGVAIAWPQLCPLPFLTFKWFGGRGMLWTQTGAGSPLANTSPCGESAGNWIWCRRKPNLVTPWIACTATPSPDKNLRGTKTPDCSSPPRILMVVELHSRMHKTEAIAESRVDALATVMHTLNWNQSLLRRWHAAAASGFPTLIAYNLWQWGVTILRMYRVVQKWHTFCTP